MISLDSKILITGSTGMIGTSLVRVLNSMGYKNLITPNRSQLDLFNLDEIDKYFTEANPEVIIIASGKTGGIKFNEKYSYELITENLMMQNNIFFSIDKLKYLKNVIFLGSSCIYPKNCLDPMKEEQILSGKPEDSSLPYAISKLAGIFTCKSINQHNENISCSTVIPASCYGPMDNFEPNNSHVLSGIMEKMISSKINNKDTVSLWGSGKPKREFIYVDDLSYAIEYLLRTQNSIPDIINVGVNDDISIKDLSEVIASIVDFSGEIIWDNKISDGQERKLLDSTKISKLGWSPKTNLQEGIYKTYSWLKKNKMIGL